MNMNYVQTAQAIARAIDRDPIMSMTIKNHISEKRILDCLDLKVVEKYENEIVRLRQEVEKASNRTIIQHIAHVWKCAGQRLYKK